MANGQNVLLPALTLGVVVFVSSFVFDWILLASGVPTMAAIVASHGFAGLVGFALAAVALRAVQERNRLLRKRLETVAALNHEIRNALAAISYSTYGVDMANVDAIRTSVARIDSALREHVPIPVPAPPRTQA